MTISFMAVTFVATASTFVVFCDKSFDSEKHCHCYYDIYYYFLHSFLFLILFSLVAGRFETCHTLGISVLIIIIVDRHKPCPYIIRSNLQSDRMQTTQSTPPMWCSLPQRPPTWLSTLLPMP